MADRAPAVDILAVAAGNLHRAYEWFEAVQCMQSGLAFFEAYERAVVRLSLAKADVDRARALSVELAEAQNVIS